MYNSILKIKEKESGTVIKYRSINPNNEALIISAVVSVLKTDKVLETYFDNLTDYFGIEIFYTEGNDEKILHLTATLNNKELIKEITNLINF